MAAYIMPRLLGEPSAAKAVWSIDAGNIVTAQWAGKTIKDLAVMDACRPDEGLIVQVWDES